MIVVYTSVTHQYTAFSQNRCKRSHVQSFQFDRRIDHVCMSLPDCILFTGVLVIDRVNGVAYVDISERADESLAHEWAKELGYKDLVTFR